MVNVAPRARANTQSTACIRGLERSSESLESIDADNFRPASEPIKSMRSSMKKPTAFLLVAAALASTPVLAAPVCDVSCTLRFAVNPGGAGPYFAPSVILATDGPGVTIHGNFYKTAVYSHEVFGAFPPVNASSFLGVRPYGGFATVPGFAGADYLSDFGFIWGSPDSDNTVTFHTSRGDETYTGSDFASMGLGFQVDGDNRGITYGFWAYAPSGETIDGITFRTPLDSGAGFEVAAIPEPSSFALLLAGMGMVAGLGRRLRRLR
jgi:hypothetical protein